MIAEGPAVGDIISVTSALPNYEARNANKLDVGQT